LCLVLLYRSDSESPSRSASIRSRFPPTIEPYVRSRYAFVNFHTTVLIPCSLSQCNLLGVGDAGGCLRLPENEASGLAPKDKSATASDLSQSGERGVILHGRELVRIGIERGRRARPDLKVGICG